MGGHSSNSAGNLMISSMALGFINKCQSQLVSHFHQPLLLTLFSAMTPFCLTVSVVSELGISDHCSVFCSLSVNKPRLPKPITASSYIRKLI